MNNILIPLIVCVTFLFSSCGGNDPFPNSHAGLKWSDASNEILSYNDAIKYCQDLGGRLPTISELRTLIQNCPDTETGGSCSVTDNCLSATECRDNCLLGCHQPSTSYSVFGDRNWVWSSSEASDSTGDIWAVLFLDAAINCQNKDVSLFSARCVRKF